MRRQISFRLRADDIHYRRKSEPNARNQDHTSWVLILRVLALDILGLVAFRGLTHPTHAIYYNRSPIHCIIILPVSPALFKQRSETTHHVGEVHRSAICWE